MSVWTPATRAWSRNMFWSTIPDFGDSFATSHETKDETSGVTFVEVLYGAKDADGNACAPERDADGHGRWLAMESGGTYRMLLWQHPKSSGGKLELARGMSEDPVNDIILTVRTKEDLVGKAQDIVASGELTTANARAMNNLMDQWKAAKGWHTPREDELWESFYAARAQFREARDAQREEAKAAKTALAEEAEAAVEKADFRNGSQYMKELMDRWKQVPSAGHDNDEELWKRFNGARKAFFNAQHEDYERRHAERGQRVAAKEILIIRAQAVTDARDYSRGAADEMRALTAEWKEIGGCGRDTDRALWAKFRAAQDPFWDERKKELDRKHEDWLVRHAEWCARMEGVIGSKQRQIERINERLDVLEYQHDHTDDERRKKELAGRIADERSSLATLENDIIDIRRKMEK